MNPFKILYFGDIVGAIGRRGVVASLPSLRKEYAPDLVVANVENLAHGRGITPKTLQELDAAGVDAYTSGNHVWENPVGLECFDDPIWKDRLTRPGNASASRPGTGSVIIEKNGVRIALVNLLGQLFMKEEASSPFAWIDGWIAETNKRPETERPQIVLIDMHAEATSEKEAFGHHVDGRVTAVLGSHTHIPTADEKILPHGTAYQTDVGRNGSHDSVIGFEKASAVSVFLNTRIGGYEIPKSGQVEINACVITADIDTGKAVALDRIRRLVEEDPGTEYSIKNDS